MLFLFSDWEEKKEKEKIMCICPCECAWPLHNVEVYTVLIRKKNVINLQQTWWKHISGMS